MTKTRNAENPGDRRSARTLRLGVVAAALLFAGLSVAVLLRPLEPDQVLEWNVLVEGYTVVALAIVAVCIYMALGLGLTATAATRARLLGRLKRFLLLTIALALCVIIFDLAMPSFMPLACYDNPLLASVLGVEGSRFFVDEEFGVCSRPGLEIHYTIDVLRDSDLLAGHEGVRPASLDEPENGQPCTIRTDRDGFMNRTEMDRCDIFAVGDSYLTPPVPYPYYWTSLLKEKTAKTVYNAGVGSYSFQQELLVLQKYGLPKSPKTVIWGYFQGNDLAEAEAFDQFRKSGLPWREYMLRLHGQTDRPFPYDRPIVKFMLSQAMRLGYANPYMTRLGYQVPCEVSTGDNRKTYLFYRHFMETVARSREDIAESRGWEICGETLLAARAECDKIGARFVVVYFPAKITVLFDQMENEYDWDVYYRYLCAQGNTTADSAAQARENLRKNRGAQGELLAKFCEQNGIEFVDTTQPLKDAAQQGRWPYFSYDSHINIEGSRVVAETLAERLKD